jgi:hypothetical protein
MPFQRDWAGNPWPFETGYGNNPDPVKKEEDGPCCDRCNETTVLPARWRAMKPANGEVG